MQNIGGENAGDAFYRYKMPKLIAKIEGRGNGIKTNVVNNVDIAKALERPPEYILKFYGCELGAQTNFDKSTGTSIVNGAHDNKVLCEKLEMFIKKYVQCYDCGNPETIVKIKKEFIYLKCKACGFLSDVDMRHKVNTFILKNPPENKLSKEEKRLKKAEEDRMRDALESAAQEKKEKKEKKKDKEKKEKKKKSKGEGEDGADAADAAAEDAASEEEQQQEESDDEVVWMTDTSEEAARRRAAEQLSAATSAMVMQGNIEAERAEAEKKAKKEAKRKAKEEEERRAAEFVSLKASLAAGDKLEPAAAEQLIRYLMEEAEGSAAKVAASGAVKKLNVEGGVAAKARAVYAALFVPAQAPESNGSSSPKSPGSPKANGSSDAAANGTSSSTKLAPAVVAAVPLLQQLASDPPGQLAQLVALEWLLTVGCPSKAKEAPLALKALYDADVTEEDIILAWHDKEDAAKVLGVPADAAAAVRKSVQAIIDWLEEASSEEDSEEESDE
jgi:translation initiation factor 5